jgi:hypothetical protein
MYMTLLLAVSTIWQGVVVALSLPLVLPGTGNVVVVVVVEVSSALTTINSYVTLTIMTTGSCVPAAIETIRLLTWEVQQAFFGEGGSGGTAVTATTATTCALDTTATISSTEVTRTVTIISVDSLFRTSTRRCSERRAQPELDSSGPTRFDCGHEGSSNLWNIRTDV